MSEAAFGLTNKGGHNLPDPRFAPRVVDPINSGMPTGSAAQGGNLEFLPDRADNTNTVTQPKTAGPIQ